MVVNCDDNFQPIGEACDFLVGVCGQLEGNHILFSISFEKLVIVPDTYKNIV